MLTPNTHEKYKTTYPFLGVLLLFAFLSSQVFASNEAQQQVKLSTPTTLVNIDVVNKAVVQKLLDSKALGKELQSLAQQIDELALADIAFDSELGLRSMLNQQDRLFEIIDQSPYRLNQYHYSLYAKAQSGSGSDFDKKLTELTIQSISAASDEELHKIGQPLGWSLSRGQDYMLWLFQRYKNEKSLSPEQALHLLSNFQLYKVYEKILPIALPLIKAERLKRYHVQTDVLVKTPDGATISAIVVRKKGDNQKRPAAFQFSIYADEKWDTKEAMHAAAHGYIGVVAYTRGKAKSPDEIVPWEHDGKDATAIIEWISRQPWSDGRVAMYGGSYLGFTQWAAAKHMHPALKTIVPYAAAHPFTGLPVENNIFITPNYQWSFHVTNNKTMDHSVYENPEHWQNVYSELFESGRAFKDIDQIEGTPNPWFQKLLTHPSYDAFYQNMLPYADDFADIDIPVLSITGYFDGGAISAIDFMKRHYQHNKEAEHYLIMGPYTHGTAQGLPRSHFGRYKLDAVAMVKDTKEITFQWFDHIFHGEPKPALVKNKVNYQLLGSNTWQHKPSYDELNKQHVTYHLSTTNEQKQFLLTPNSVNADEFVSLTVDLADRKTQHNEYSWQFLHEKFTAPNGLVYSTTPFATDVELAGEITGYFSLAINKKDVDIGFKLYEVNPDGSAYLLTRYISRASYADNMSERQLLTPHKKTQVPIINSRMIGKLIKKGSRLVIVLNVNKNMGAQVNMGTGRDVSEETIADAGEPLEIKWYADSKLNIPLKVK